MKVEDNADEGEVDLSILVLTIILNATLWWESAPVVVGVTLSVLLSVAAVMFLYTYGITNGYIHRWKYSGSGELRMCLNCKQWEHRVPTPFTGYTGAWSCDCSYTPYEWHCLKPGNPPCSWFNHNETEVGHETERQAG